MVPGTLSVVGLGRAWVDVYVDGTLRGSAPLTDIPLSPGPRQLSFRRDDFRKDVQLDVQAGGSYGFIATVGNDGKLQVVPRN